MQVKARFCFNGNNNYSVEFTTRDGRRTRIRVDEPHWSRRLATRALDHVSYDLDIPRHRIRFV